MSDNSCIFCKLASGEFQSATVYEDDLFRAILDISPASKGHTLLLPKKHAANLFELEEPEVSRALSVAKKLAIAIQKTLNCDGINILQNNGTAAGQSVFHFHIHLIPRYENDGVTIPWEALSYSNGEAAQLANKIHQNL
ncbi:HIT family protein [Lachnoclostridium phytofermentans]|uniref:Histidine triad (HIT) protein n=1 Tax=Lachnoclostridium phytofermentans (strain ATCC 700394 / DSM 18823 / ISDg) TaxID=357809 RepID=A9KK82_LACP7|nr:HIT family protein [Lachnoclostridium phytofermentans]ABX44073.1 histidine triad (HIT) protein [Lachnoclostridium phytofermentans ISDg]